MTRHMFLHQPASVGFCFLLLSRLKLTASEDEAVTVVIMDAENLPRGPTVVVRNRAR